MRMLKFAGTSVWTPDCLTTALTIVEQHSRAERTAVVVPTLAGVTNRLVEGIGAGPKVTARGVLADVILTALEIAA